MNEQNNTQVNGTTGSAKSINQIGNTTFFRRGRKWHFTTPIPASKGGGTYEAALMFPGQRMSAALAERIAPLFESDVTRHGRFGSNRSNVERLVASAQKA